MTNAFSAAALHCSSFKRVAVYTRFSTIMQRPSSSVDQLRSCQEAADSLGWTVLEDHIYADCAVSGTSTAGRSGFAALEQAAEQRPLPFDCVLMDDTSRCARDVEDILHFVKMMRFNGVRVLFVSQKLDSADPGFDMAVQLYAMFDAQLVDRIRAKVVSGQKGRVLAGYHVGSVAYGYKVETDYNTATADLVGRATTLGSKLVIIEERAQVVVRIFTLFVDGHSMLGIAKLLNEDKIASPKNTKAGKRLAQWSPDAIKDVLQNERYKGWNVWNVSEQVENPKTKKMVKVFKPAHQHIRIFSETWRIVSDELWEAAASRRKLMNDAQLRRVQGGYNRATIQAYLYSGFLFCGNCGSKLIIGGKQGYGRYRCHNHRHHSGCDNGIAIPEQFISKQITEVLAEQLLQPANFEALSTEVFEELQLAFQKQVKSVSQEQLAELQAQHKKCSTAIVALIDSIEEGDSPALKHRLAQREFEKSQLERKISLLKGKKKLQVTREGLDQLIRENIARLVEVLQTNVPLARLILSQHLLKMFVYYDEKADPKKAFVLGGFDLFQGENAIKKGVLLGDLGTQTPQQHTVSSVSACNFSIALDLNLDKDCLLVEPLVELLANDPSLSLEPKKPGTWAKLLAGHMGQDRVANLKLGSGAIGRCFRVHRKLIEEQIVMVKTVNPEATMGHLYQLSLRADAELISEGRSTIALPAASLAA